MRSDQHAFATLRFAGDALEPEAISAILDVPPTRAYRKGQEFSPGPRTPRIRGRTGVWFLSTKGKVPGEDLGQHVSFLARLLSEEGQRIARLRDLMGRDKLRAHVSCFWYGPEGAREPSLPGDAIAVFERLPAEIETDFYTD